MIFLTTVENEKQYRSIKPTCHDNKQNSDNWKHMFYKVANF